MKTIPLGIMSAIVAFGLCAGAAQAQTSLPAAASIANNISMCMGCHGIEAYKTAFPQVYSVPKIAGQSPQYIIKALQAYRSGERNHPSMQGIARSLSDKEMAALADYYGGAAK